MIMNFQWHITDYCNQRCQHCYVYGANPDKQPEFMPLDTVIFMRMIRNAG